MSNYVEETKTNLIDFYEDSVSFMQKCTKPDKKGSLSSSNSRVYQDRHILRTRLRYHGQCRLRNQANLHSNQQDLAQLTTLAYA